MKAKNIRPAFAGRALLLVAVREEEIVVGKLLKHFKKEKTLYVFYIY